MSRKISWGVGFLFFFLFTLSACTRGDKNVLTATSSPSSTNKPVFTPTSSPSPTQTLTPSPTSTKTNTPTHTSTPTQTDTPTETPSPSITPSPTISPTPTLDFPDVIVNVGSAHCRFGPGKAYLHAADLYEGDHGLVWNRNYAGSWLWVRFDKLHYACWVAASVTAIEGDIFSVSVYMPPLPKSELYEPPKKVTANRSGDQVLVTWDEVWMTEDDDRGYLLQTRICQNGNLIDLAVHTNGNSYTFLDEKGCSDDSKGRLFAVEKHGYTDPISIPWP
jgi:hypothetical protein